MDPGQADDATYAGDAEESWARALLCRGWALSRKAAIAGVAAMAAPVVAPQIIILSIASVGLSVPFAACLISVAAADRLTAALLPTVAPPRPCCYSCYDDVADEESSEQELLHMSGVPDGQEEEDAVLEQDEGFASLPLSREPLISEELIPLLANEEGDSAEGEYASQNSGLKLVVPKDGKRKEIDTAIDVDTEYITMEAPSPGIVSFPEVPVSREEDDLVRRMEEDAPVPSKESVPELSVSNNEKKTEDGKSATAVGNESSKEMLFPGQETTESSDLTLPILGHGDIMVHGDVKGDVSVGKWRKDAQVSDTADKTEPHKTTDVKRPNEVSVSESQGLEDNMVLSKVEDEIAVEMAPREEVRYTNPVTGEVVGVQSAHPVARELQALTESAPVHDTLGSNIREGTVNNTDNKTVEGVHVGHYAEGGMSCMLTVDDDKDLISSTHRWNVSAISDGMTNVRSKPHADQPNQTTYVSNKGDGKEKVAEDKCVKRESKTMDNKVRTTDMASQDDSISKSLVPDDQSTREDQATVEIVLEQVTSSIDPTTGEVVEVEADIIARESETLPLSDLVAHESQVVTRARTVDNKTEDIVKDIGDTNVVDVEDKSGEGASSFVSFTSVLTMDDGEGRMSSRSIPYVSAISDDMTSVEGRSDLEHYHQTTGVEYKLMDREFKTKVLAENKDIYTEEELREQLNTLRTIIGYRAVPSLTLEGELADLYIFVGVEPPPSSGGAFSLTELKMKLRFLKSIIGVE